MLISPELANPSVLNLPTTLPENNIPALAVKIYEAQHQYNPVLSSRMQECRKFYNRGFHAVSAYVPPPLQAL